MADLYLTPQSRVIAMDQDRLVPEGSILDKLSLDEHGEKITLDRESARNSTFRIDFSQLCGRSACFTASTSAVGSKSRNLDHPLWRAHL